MYKYKFFAANFERAKNALKLIFPTYNSISPTVFFLERGVVPHDKQPVEVEERVRVHHQVGGVEEEGEAGVAAGDVVEVNGVGDGTQVKGRRLEK